MRITQIIRLALIIFLLMLYSFALAVGVVSAKTQYVSDELIITLREGKGNEYKIIKMLKTGTPLEIVEEGDPYLKVRTESGDEGWVLKQYLTEDIPKPKIIAGLEKKVERLNTDIKNYKKEKESLQDKLKSTRSDYNREIGNLKQNVSESRGNAEQTERKLEKITEKYNTLIKDSKNVVQLVKERDSLKESNSRLQTETGQLRKENDRLKSMEMIWWFAAGGGVFFVGWIVGKISRQKRFY